MTEKRDPIARFLDRNDGLIPPLFVGGAATVIAGIIFELDWRLMLLSGLVGQVAMNYAWNGKPFGRRR